MTRTFRAFAALLASVSLSGGAACGDVTSDLITGSSGGSSAGSPAAGASSSGTGSGGTPECTIETAAEDCTDPERRLCHPTRLVCVECSNQGHCEADEDCSDALGECARSCTTVDDCIEADDRVCDTSIGGFCVECVANSDCPSNVCALWECQ